MRRRLRLLNCIISHNRPHYLRNLVESLEKYFPYGDTIVVDDQSTDERVTGYLLELGARGVPVLGTTVERAGLVHGGLYHAMDLGLAYARDRSYQYISYLQDDLQCLWLDADFERTIEGLFASSTSVLSVHSLFLKGIMAYQMPARISRWPGGDAYHLKPYALPDASIVSVPRFAAQDVSFARFGNEKALNRVLYERGLMSLIPRAPHFAFVPWPKTIRSGVEAGREAPPRMRYYLRPLSERQRRALRRPGASLPYAERYCGTWRYWSIKPFWFTEYGPAYRRMLLRNLRAGIPMLPRPSVAL